MLKVKLDGEVDITAIASYLDMYSGSDITSVCKDAAMSPLRRAIEGKSLDAVKSIMDGTCNSTIYN